LVEWIKAMLRFARGFSIGKHTDTRTERERKKEREKEILIFTPHP